MGNRSLIVSWMLRIEGSASLVFAGWLVMGLLPGDGGRSQSSSCTGPLAAVLGPVFAALLWVFAAALGWIGANSLVASRSVARGQSKRTANKLLGIFGIGWALASAYLALCAAAPESDWWLGLSAAAAAAAVGLLHACAALDREATGSVAARTESS